MWSYILILTFFDAEEGGEVDNFFLLIRIEEFLEYLSPHRRMSRMIVVE
jgi:hypothetical protein